jgi:hypothetical protein
MNKNKPKLKAGQVWKDMDGDLSYIAAVKKNPREEDMIMGDVSLVVITGPKAGKYFPDETSGAFGIGCYFNQQVA